MLVAVLLVALNLRPAITSLGPMLEEVRAGLGMNGTVAGLLTSLPPICFALFGVIGPMLARRIGRVAVICLAMVALTLGIVLRSFTESAASFLAATMLSMAGIAVSNVLLPVLVKEEFPDRVAMMTGVYSMSMAVGTAFPAAAAVPVEHALGGGWRPGLAVWATFAVLALLPWLGLLTDRSRRGRPTVAASTAGSPGDAAREPRMRVWRSVTAWTLAGYFGMQSGAAYIVMGWLPQIYRDAGVSAGSAGMLLAVAQIVSVPMSFVIPALAGRMSDQRPIAAGLVLFGFVGYAGLAFSPASWSVLWALLLGVSLSAFPLALLMIGMRTRTGVGVTQLSTFAQSVGYLIAIPAPILIGALNGATSGWRIPIAVMVGLLTVQLGFGLLAGRRRYVEDDMPRQAG